MYTFQDEDTGYLVEFKSIEELTLAETRDYMTSKVTGYFVELHGERHRVSEAFYNKVLENQEADDD